MGVSRNRQVSVAGSHAVPAGQHLLPHGGAPVAVQMQRPEGRLSREPAGQVQVQVQVAGFTTRPAPQLTQSAPRGVVSLGQTQAQVMGSCGRPPEHHSTQRPPHTSSRSVSQAG